MTGRAALLARSLAFEAWFWVSMLAMGVAFAPAALVSRRAARAAMRLFCAQALLALRLICGLRTELRGAIPDSALVIAAKHQSFLDVLMLMRWTPRPAFVMKRSLVRVPVLGLYALRIGALPIDRSRGAASLRAIAAHADTIDGQLVVFPQGTRVAPDDRATPYRRGAAMAALATGRPALPIATNAGRFWARGSMLRRPGRAVLEVLEPLPPEGDAASLTAALATRIETASRALDESS